MRLVIALAVVLAVVVAVFALGWADDRAAPGTRGRAPVSVPAPTTAP
jgi:FlaG/FlaF family flagellin (archaellin)